MLSRATRTSIGQRDRRRSRNRRVPWYGRAEQPLKLRTMWAGGVSDLKITGQLLGSGMVSGLKERFDPQQRGFGAEFTTGKFPGILVEARESLLRCPRLQRTPGCVHAGDFAGENATRSGDEGCGPFL